MQTIAAAPSIGVLHSEPRLPDHQPNAGNSYTDLPGHVNPTPSVVGPQSPPPDITHTSSDEPVYNVSRHDR
jgi:hypothetical protein